MSTIIYVSSASGKLKRNTTHGEYFVILDHFVDNLGCTHIQSKFDASTAIDYLAFDNEGFCKRACSISDICIGFSYDGTDLICRMYTAEDAGGETGTLKQCPGKYRHHAKSTVWILIHFLWMQFIDFYSK